MSVRERRRDLLQKIREAAEEYNRKASQVELIAVSKTQSVPDILEAFAAGQLVFGENYFQEAKTKQQQISSTKVRWHFIGHIQSNKAKDLVGKFDLIHSVDRLKVAEIISKRAQELGIVQSILLEINVGGEESKSGMSPDQCREVFSQIRALEGIRVKGLMCFPPLVEDFNQQRSYFAECHKLKVELEQTFDCELPELSMGTTLDFKAAIAEGSTMVRVGTALFGRRA